MTPTDTTTTTDPITRAVDAYLAVWNEPDAGTRAELARWAFSATARLVDPLVDATGPDDIAAAIGALQGQMPDHTIARTSGIETHHELSRFTWAASGPDGVVAIAGTDVVTIDADGRISGSVAFFGEAPAR